MRQYSNKKNASFLKKNNLTELKTDLAYNREYNGYQSTPIVMCDALVKSNILSKDDALLDVGCGCGIFLCFLALNGFTNLYGVEINDILFDKALENFDKLTSRKKLALPKITKTDFFLHNNFDEISNFYLFNTFNSENLYLNFFDEIHKSLERNNRKIKIIFLYPTVYLRKALTKCTWLSRIKTIVDKKQFCAECIRIEIYENV